MVIRCELCKKQRKKHGITLHKFPANVKERQKWIDLIGSPNWVPAKNAAICSNHFTADCFERWFKRIGLRKHSMPTIFNKNLDEDTASYKKRQVAEPPHVKNGPPALPESQINFSRQCSLVEEVSPSITTHVSVAPVSPRLNQVNFKRESNLRRDANHAKILPCMTTPTKNLARHLNVSSMEVSFSKNMSTSMMNRQHISIQHDHRYEDSPETNRNKLNIIKRKYEISKKNVRALKKQVKILQRTVYSLKTMVSTLTKRKRVPETVSSIFPSFSNTPLPIFT